MDQNLIDEGNDLLIEVWEEQKEALKEGIDKAIERGKADKNVLCVMRELLNDDIVKPRKKTIEEYFEKQDKLNK